MKGPWREDQLTFNELPLSDLQYWSFTALRVFFARQYSCYHKERKKEQSTSILQIIFCSCFKDLGLALPAGDTSWWHHLVKLFLTGLTGRICPANLQGWTAGFWACVVRCGDRNQPCTCVLLNKGGEIEYSQFPKLLSSTLPADNNIFYPPSLWKYRKVLVKHCCASFPTALDFLWSTCSWRPFQHPRGAVVPPQPFPAEGFVSLSLPVVTRPAGTPATSSAICSGRTTSEFKSWMGQTPNCSFSPQEKPKLPFPI